MVPGSLRLLVETWLRVIGWKAGKEQSLEVLVWGEMVVVQKSIASPTKPKKKETTQENNEVFRPYIKNFQSP